MLFSSYSGPLPKPEALHIPDGFLSAPVAVLAWLISVAFIVVAVRISSRTLDERQVPMMGVLAAFIFAAQAFNFPVAGGTSGHMLGGALVAILLGPWPGLLVMTAVIALQALIFQDGGLLAMGANILIMGILTVWVGYFTYRLLSRFNGYLAAFLAGWLSVEVAAIVTAALLALSGTSALAVVLPAMAGVHAFIGIGEGLITAAALALVQKALPGFFDHRSSGGRTDTATLFAGGVVLTLIVGILAVFFASGSPDGLEWVAEDLGFLGAAQESPFQIAPDYAVPGISSDIAANLLAVGIGILLLFAVGYTVARSLRRRQTQSA
ncbi:MAG: energy-coupling factor ABC transporter permease [Chloroflexota bacterium]|nr:energy-coupling factor ABC transporter permease [Chloroflexota bacterium]